MVEAEEARSPRILRATCHVRFRLLFVESFASGRNDRRRVDVHYEISMVRNRGEIKMERDREGK